MSTERVNILEELKVDVMSGAKVFEDRYFVVEEFLGDREARYSLFDEEVIVDTEFFNGEFIHTVYKRETNEKVFSSCFFNVNDLLDKIEEELDEIREEERKYAEGLRKNIEFELERIFAEYKMPEDIIEEIIENVKETSDYNIGAYSSSDVTLSIQRILLDHVDFDVF